MVTDRLHGLEDEGGDVTAVRRLEAHRTPGLEHGDHVGSHDVPATPVREVLEP